MLHMHLQDLHYPSKPVAPNLYISKNKVNKLIIKINLVIIILFFKYKIVSKFLSLFF